MSREDGEGFCDGDRHGWMATWCSTLERIIVGQAAKDVLERGLIEDGCLVVLPVWAWAHSIIDVGRKDHATDGGKLLLPIRVTWNLHTVSIVQTTTSVKASWEAIGMGVHLHGNTELRGFTDMSRTTPGLRATDHPAATMDVPWRTADENRAALGALAEDGHAAWWGAIQSLEGFVERAVVQAHTYISADAALGYERAPLLDAQALVACRDRLLLGDPGEDSSVSRILKRSLDPAAFDHCDPQKYVADALRRDSQLAVRKSVGDTPTGSKIRAIARELDVSGPKDAQQVLDVYRDRYPKDRMGIQRVVTALSVRPATTQSLYRDGVERGSSLWPTSQTA